VSSQCRECSRVVSKKKNPKDDRHITGELLPKGGAKRRSDRFQHAGQEEEQQTGSKGGKGWKGTGLCHYRKLIRTTDQLGGGHGDIQMEMGREGYWKLVYGKTSDCRKEYHTQQLKDSEKGMGESKESEDENSQKKDV